jgi:hypothetical protein
MTRNCDIRTLVGIQGHPSRRGGKVGNHLLKEGPTHHKCLGDYSRQRDSGGCVVPGREYRGPTAVELV